MLKVYKVHDYVSIDGAKWRQVGYGYRIAEEKPENNLVLYEASFDNAREYLSNNKLDGVWNDSTFLFRNPTIVVDYDDAWESVEYRKFKNISYQTIFTEWTSVTLEWIVQNLPADECIQYLKERGMTVCPILK